MNSRNLQIDGLRGATITIIVFYHIICRFSEIYLGKTIPVMNYWGTGGVSVFLLISSYYLISSASGSLKSIVKKVFRLWPSYVVSITLTQIILSFLPLPGRTCTWLEYIWNIPFVNGFIDIPYVDGAHWYITTLISLIVTTGLFGIVGINDKRITYLLWMLFVFFLAKIFYSNLAQCFGGNYVGIASIGIAIKNISWINLKNKKYDAWFVVVTVGFLYSGIMLGIRYFIVLLVAVPLVIATTEKKVHIFEKRLFQFVGIISYPLYLAHQNIGMAIEYKLLSIFGEYSYWFSAITIFVVFIIATALYRLVELPVQRVLKKHLRLSAKNPVC